MKAVCTLQVHVVFDNEVTDEDSIAAAMDKLLETATSTPGILDEYGNPSIGEFEVAIGRDA